jgi:hypothetical protein
MSTASVTQSDTALVPTLWVAQGQEPVLRTLLNGVMTDIGEPPFKGKKFYRNRKDETHWRGEYCSSGKKGNVRAEKNKRSRVRNDVGNKRPVKNESAENIKEKKTRSVIEAKKKQNVKNTDGVCSEPYVSQTHMNP